MDYGIIFEDSRSDFVAPLSEKLRDLGLTHYKGDTLTDELLDSLNDYRAANFMRELDYCEPTVLRTLGIESMGEEIVTLAGYAEAISQNEIECYEACCKMLNESRKCAITPTEAAIRISNGKSVAAPSKESVAAALLAFLNK